MHHDSLLDALTPAAGADALVAAAQAGARRRRTLRDCAAAAVILAISAGALTLLPVTTPPPAVAVAPATEAPPARLTGDELLEAFGDQPVALVTYPDGRQQLIAILRPGARSYAAVR